MADILVAEGIITNGESVITLSRSVNLLDDEVNFTFVNNAIVYVECEEDESRMYAEEYVFPRFNGRYLIHTGTLNPDYRYRLRIEIDESVYGSDYTHPIQTPEIDSIFWTKRGRGQPVNIHVATHSPDNRVLYYRWSYREDWEFQSYMYHDDYTNRCWQMAVSREILIGSPERTVFGRITDIINTVSPSSAKFSSLYRITVTQNAISKRAYDYFANVKKNAQQIGSIFAPIPSELRGNIRCLTEPDRPVIGFIDISTTTQKIQYIRPQEVYEFQTRWECRLYSIDEMREMYEEGPFPEHYVIYEAGLYVILSCVDCSVYGTRPKPDDWPN